MIDLNKIHQEQKKVRSEIKQRTVGYIVAALGLVAGLAWNDAIKSIIEAAFPLNKGSIPAKLIYAVVVTMVIVLVTVYLIRLSGPEQENK